MGMTRRLSAIMLTCLLATLFLNMSQLHKVKHSINETSNNNNNVKQILMQSKQNQGTMTTVSLVVPKTTNDTKTFEWKKRDLDRNIKTKSLTNAHGDPSSNPPHNHHHHHHHHHHQEAKEEEEEHQQFLEHLQPPKRRPLEARPDIDKPSSRRDDSDKVHHTIAGLNCERYGGPSQDIAKEMVYWRDISSDATFQSPFAKLNTKESPKYLTFEPDEGGWNNIRMGMETAIVMAYAMGRTLVLPPEQRMYLLTKDLSFHDFFHLDSLRQEHMETFNIITMKEFLKREAITGGLRNTTSGKVIFPPRNRTNWDSGTKKLSRIFKKYIRHVADNNHAKWFFDDCIAAFPNETGTAGGERIRQMMRNLRADVTTTPMEREKSYRGNPTPVNATPYARLRELQANRHDVCVYGSTFQNHKLHHLLGDNNSGARLLVHFYGFLFFEDWHTDLWVKRFVRDHLRYVDEIQCAAARIVHALRTIAIENGNPNGEFDTFHIRRGDFQYKNTRISCSEILNNTEDLLQPNSTIFIATDELDKSFFEPFREAGQHIYFLDDFKHLLGPNFKTTYYGMVDQRIASRGRTFIGAYFSTFTGYINRMRGYHSQKERNPLNGYKEGILNSYYYVPLRFKHALREYRSVVPPMWAREFPIGWRDIDHDVEATDAPHVDRLIS